MGCRTRLMGDVTDLNNQTTGGRGNLSFTSINLPRIAIRNGICLKERDKADMDNFYKELSDVMDLVITSHFYLNKVFGKMGIN